MTDIFVRYWIAFCELGISLRDQREEMTARQVYQAKARVDEEMKRARERAAQADLKRR